MIVDDVITAGTSVRESVDLIRAHGANPAGMLIAFDRMERGQGERSAIRNWNRELFGIPVIAIATLDDVMRFHRAGRHWRSARRRGAVYRAQYGARRYGSSERPGNGVRELPAGVRIEMRKGSNGTSQRRPGEARRERGEQPPHRP